MDLTKSPSNIIQCNHLYKENNNFEGYIVENGKCIFLRNEYSSEKFQEKENVAEFKNVFSSSSKHCYH